ncbi:hypothetical protein C0Q70_04782 [Pomacea canaliculata]|uniref:Uncharacterized protein n=1 Tax=Pomacea canaliculata TaxID=400727 RepID=A0A2T7PJB7_POMCA|nr:hypothetical protein C0Q70_04782 [Pomacea canaliculata]
MFPLPSILLPAADAWALMTIDGEDGGTRGGATVRLGVSSMLTTLMAMAVLLWLKV